MARILIIEDRPASRDLLVSLLGYQHHVVFEAHDGTEELALTLAERPDLVIFCIEPPDIDESWEQVPEAVIEIVSLGYEEKDLSINPPWYLAMGVKDVLVADHGRARCATTATAPRWLCAASPRRSSCCAAAAA